ncbi:MAG: HD domain-containing protein [Fusobacteria bacterium]|nr:HD domain-containing protein [Fusobacteriota bacterium]
MRRDLFSVIFITLKAIKFKMVQKIEDHFEVLEEGEYTLNLASDLFSKGRVEFRNVEYLSEVINRIMRLASGYQIVKIKLYGISSLKEAENIDYIYDQLLLKTKLYMRILENQEEQLYFYKMALKEIRNNEDLLASKTLSIVSTGTGNLSIGYYRDREIQYVHNFKNGIVKLIEIFSEVRDEAETLHHIILENYLKNTFDSVKKFMPFNVSEILVVSGREMKQLRERLGFEEKTIFEIEELEELYFEYGSYKVEVLAEKLDVSESTAVGILYTLALYKVVAELTESKKIVILETTIQDAIMESKFFRKRDLNIENQVENSILRAVKRLGRRYQYNEEHAVLVQDLSLKIYDELQNLHAMGKKERFYLELASLSHDMGKFVNLSEHQKYSHNILMASDIIGLLRKEKQIVANVVLHHGKQEKINFDGPTFRDFTASEKVMVAKLTAILKIADSLEAGNAHLMKDTEFKLDGKILYIFVKQRIEELMMIQLHFKKSHFFTDVFGIRVELKNRK